MLCAWFPDVNQIVDRRFRFVVAGAKLIENHSQHRFFFLPVESFQINITFIRSAVPATDDTCFNQNCIAFLLQFKRHFSHFFTTVFAITVLTFPPGPKGWDPPSLTSSSASTIQLFTADVTYWNQFSIFTHWFSRRLFHSERCGPRKFSHRSTFRRKLLLTNLIAGGIDETKLLQKLNSTSLFRKTRY